MLCLTFLKGIKPDYQASKTFRKIGKKVHKVSDYDIGATFNHNHRTIPQSHLHLAAELQRRAEHGWFHIYGPPIQNLPQKVPRRKVNFPECPTSILVMDIDKFKLPPEIAKLWVDASPAATTQVIIATLKHLKLDVLAAANFTFVLSSSQLNRSILSVHLYFFLSEPVELRDLRRWALLINKSHGNTTVDGSIYKSVQPVYISPPVCENFADPFPKGTRIAYHEPAPNTTVLVDQLKKLGLTMNKIPTPTTNVSEHFDSYAGAAEKKEYKLKKTWTATVESFVGTKERGINKPAHRAAAQMVQQEGTEAIKEKLDEYVKAFHGEMWQAIKTHGVRGNQSDIDTYTEDKARSYIESAMNKEFGKEADQLGDLVSAAIDKALKDGSSAPLLAPDTLRAAGRLMSQHEVKWYDIRNTYKSKVAKLVPISSFEKRVRMASSNTASDISTDDMSEACDQVISRMTLLLTPDGIKYVHWLDSTMPLKYVCLNIADHRFSGAVGELYRSLTKKRLYSQDRNMLVDNIIAAAQYQTMRTVKSAVVGERRIRTADAVYYRVGEYNGEELAAVMDKNGVTFKKADSLGVYWSGLHTPKVRVPNKEQLKAVFSTDKPTFEQARDYLNKHLPNLISCHPDDLPQLMAVAASILIPRPVRYLAVFEGKAESGKSFGAAVFKCLFDSFNEDDTFKEKKSDLPKSIQLEHKLALQGNEVTIYDNLYGLTSTQQNFLSTLATGVESSIRLLYTQRTADIILDQNIILTCITDPVSLPDLKSRSVTIDFDSVQQHRITNFQDLFTRQAPFIRYCWFMVAAELLKNLSNPQLSGVTARGTMLAICSVIFKNAKYTTSDLVSGTMQEEIAKKQFDLIGDSDTMMFIAFLDSHENDTTIEFTATERYDKYQDWARINDRQTKKVTLVNENHQIGHQKVVVSLYNTRHRTAKGFDNIIGGAANAISLASQWRAVKRRDPKTRQIVWTYVNKFNDIL